MGDGKANTIGAGNSRLLEKQAGQAKPGHCKPGACKAGHCTIELRHGYGKRDLVKKQIFKDGCDVIKKAASCCKACYTQLSQGHLVHATQGTEPLKLDQNNNDDNNASK